MTCMITTIWGRIAVNDGCDELHKQCCTTNKAFQKVLSFIIYTFSVFTLDGSCYILYQSYLKWHYDTFRSIRVAHYDAVHYTSWFQVLLGRQRPVAVQSTTDAELALLPTAGYDCHVPEKKACPHKSLEENTALSQVSVHILWVKIVYTIQYLLKHVRSYVNFVNHQGLFQVYLYEANGKDHSGPRHCLPHAIITCEVWRETCQEYPSQLQNTHDHM